MFNNANSRIKLVTVIYIIALLACVIGICRLAFVQRKDYNGTAEDYIHYSQDEFEMLTAEQRDNCVVEEHVNPTRGTIFDDHGRPLVTSVRVYAIGVDGRNFNTKHEFFAENSPYLDTLISDLANNFFKLFGERYPKRNVDYYKQSFSKAFKEHKRVQLFFDHEVTVYKQMIVDKDLEAIKKMPLFSRTIEEKDRGRYGLAGREKIYFPNVLDKGGNSKTVRLRPYGDMASRILGDPRHKNGIDGCEMFNPILTGEAGVRSRLYMNGVSVPLTNENPPIEGGDLYTTLNIEIQNIVHQSLLEQCQVAKPKWGCAIVMETATGDIKGISNFEQIITNNDTAYLETRNFAMVADVSEPGSTFKLASLLAYLEKTDGDTVTPFTAYRDTFKVGKRVYHKTDKKDAPNGEKVSIKKIIQMSSNVGVVNMMRSAYPKFSDYVAKLNEMYITVGFSAQIGNIHAVANLRPETRIFEEQYSRYFGASFNMPPIRTLVYYNAVANGGKMMAPRFVKSSRVEGKVTEYEPKVIAEQIVSKKTIAIAQDILRSVVTDGTARRAANRVAPGIEFSGKTGTRDIYDVKLGAYNKNRNAVSFCGYFPSKCPKYTCIVYLFDAPYPATSGNAITVFANIAKKILNPPHKIEKTNEPAMFAHTVRSTSAQRLLAKYGLKYAQKNGKAEYCTVDSEKPKTFKSVTIDKIGDKVPNVVGMNASDAVTELRKAGFKTRLSGCGIVKSQSNDIPNKTVVLTLSPG